MKLFIKWHGDESHEQDEIIDVIDGDSNQECEEEAEKMYFETDKYYWTYNEN